MPRELNPTTLTAGCFWPRAQLPRADEDGEASKACENGFGSSLPNRASWTKGLDALFGGEPQKNGGDDGTGLSTFSPS
ncbi:hypothetical protein HanXRQr2_Chr08g0341781 [Helianthus annuus]|uniref:Uncharacterized protein n=1 Tax=Helianthus annuus TaxID=4232 RepID=A0A9K3IFH5_HELAN|nr:hypothetical protein HanXRQr2_Chr08g0341781 [Helianthus annuus]KAJ0901855.1 hypothetical protein HanPSC8_Chr08g0330161 [Helianthus annuus]